jgi:hypothetical protein
MLLFNGQLHSIFEYLSIVLICVANARAQSNDIELLDHQIDDTNSTTTTMTSPIIPTYLWEIYKRKRRQHVESYESGIIESLQTLAASNVTLSSNQLLITFNTSAISSLDNTRIDLHLYSYTRDETMRLRYNVYTVDADNTQHLLDSRVERMNAEWIILDVTSVLTILQNSLSEQQQLQLYVDWQRLTFDDNFDDDAMNMEPEEMIEFDTDSTSATGPSLLIQQRQTLNNDLILQMKRLRRDDFILPQNDIS